MRLKPSRSATPSIDYQSTPVYGVLSPNDPDDPVYTHWTTDELIDDLSRDEASSIFEFEVDPDGPFRYTGEFDGWWQGLKEVAKYGDSDADRIRAAILEMRASN